MRNRWVKIAIAIVVAFVLFIGLVPLFVHADTFRPRIEDELSSALGRKVSLGHLSFSLVAGSLKAENISIADDSAFSSGPFLEAKQLDLGVKAWKFIFYRSVEITNLTIDSPSLHFIHNQQKGTWNFSSLGSGSAASAQASQPASQQGSAMPALSVDKIAIKNGSATMSSLPAEGKPLACTAINFSIEQFSLTHQFPFQLSVKLPGDGSLQLKGTAGPLSQANIAATPFRATLDLKKFDPVKANLVEPSTGISMLADFNAQIVSDGASLTSIGKIKANRLLLSRSGTPATQPVDVDYSVSSQIAARIGRVIDLAIHTGSLATHTTGSFRMEGDATVVDLHFSADKLPIDQLEQLLPAVGVTLPSGSRLKGGTLTAALAISGPVSAATIAGPVEIENTALAGFDLGSKIEGLNPFGGTKNGTQIEKFSTDLNSSPQTTRFDNISASVPSIGTASGSGTVAASGALDFQLVAKLKSSTVVGGIANAGMDMVGLLGGKRNAAGNGIPLTITGTTANPSIKANVGSMLKQDFTGKTGQSSGQSVIQNAGQQKNNPVQGLKGLLRK